MYLSYNLECAQIFLYYSQIFEVDIADYNLKCRIVIRHPECQPWYYIIDSRDYSDIQLMNIISYLLLAYDE